MRDWGWGHITNMADVAGLRRALVLALADYAGKCGFGTAVLGISGGVDSAVTAALEARAVEAVRGGAGEKIKLALQPFELEARRLVRRRVD